MELAVLVDRRPAIMPVDAPAVDQTLTFWGGSIYQGSVLLGFPRRLQKFFRTNWAYQRAVCKLHPEVECVRLDTAVDPKTHEPVAYPGFFCRQCGGLTPAPVIEPYDRVRVYEGRSVASKFAQADHVLHAASPELGVYKNMLSRLALPPQPLRLPDIAVTGGLGGTPEANEDWLLQKTLAVLHGYTLLQCQRVPDWTTGIQTWVDQETQTKVEGYEFTGDNGEIVQYDLLPGFRNELPSDAEVVRPGTAIQMPPQVWRKFNQADFNEFNPELFPLVYSLVLSEHTHQVAEAGLYKGSARVGLDVRAVKTVDRQAGLWVKAQNYYQAVDYRDLTGLASPYSAKQDIGRLEWDLTTLPDELLSVPAVRPIEINAPATIPQPAAITGELLFDPNNPIVKQVLSRV
jgi:hypothetical protein